MLERYIAKGNNYKTFFLIGSNGAGKTYNLLKIYERDTTKNIYISEEGEIHNRTHKNKVKLDLDNKVYIFETKTSHIIIFLPSDKYLLVIFTAS